MFRPKAKKNPLSACAGRGLVLNRLNSYVNPSGAWAWVTPTRTTERVTVKRDKPKCAPVFIMGKNPEYFYWVRLHEMGILIKKKNVFHVSSQNRLNS